MIIVAVQNPAAYKHEPTITIIEMTVSSVICLLSLALIIFPLRHPVARYSVYLEDFIHPYLYLS